MYVQNLELGACTPLVPGIFWPRKIQNFGSPGMHAGVRPKHERTRMNTFTNVQVLDVHEKLNVSQILSDVQSISLTIFISKSILQSL